MSNDSRVFSNIVGDVGGPNSKLFFDVFDDNRRITFVFGKKTDI